MEPATWGFIGTLIGTIVGASASILTSFIAGRNARVLQKEAEMLERQERAREFQRNNLLSLQDSLSIGMRLIGRAHLEDVEAFRKSGTGERASFLNEEISQELLVSNRQISVLTERIADDELRINVKVLRGKMNSVLMAKSEVESMESIFEASTSFENTMENLGIVLRSSY